MARGEEGLRFEHFSHMRRKDKSRGESPVRLSAAFFQLGFYHGLNGTEAFGG